MSYTVSRCDACEKRATILGLWRRNFPAGASDRYDWLYGDGTALEWILRSPAGETVGSAGLMRRQLDVLGNALPGGQAIDINVDREHRSLGPALQLQHAVAAAARSGEVALIYAFPNAGSEGVQRRVGYQLVGPFGRWTKPLRGTALLGQRARHPWLRRPLDSLLSIGLRIASPETFHRLPQGLTVEEPPLFDSRFDALWSRVRSQFAVIGCRTRDYLTWRFGQSPATKFRTLCLIDDAGTMLAYAVYHAAARRTYISDFLFTEPDHLRTILCELLRRARRAGQEAVTTACLGPRRVTETLDRLGFWRRSSQWNVLVCVPPNNANAQRILDGSGWFMTRADADTDF